MRRRPEGTSLQPADLVQCSVDIGHGRADPGQQHLAGLGQRDAAGGAVHQADAEPLFHSRSRWLRLDTDTPCSSAAAGNSGSGHGDERHRDRAGRYRSLFDILNKPFRIVQLIAAMRSASYQPRDQARDGPPPFRGEAPWNTASSARPAPTSPPSASAAWACPDFYGPGRPQREHRHHPRRAGGRASPCSTPAISTAWATTRC